MPINIPALDTLDAAAVAQASEAAVEWTQEGFPGVDLSGRGVVGDLVVGAGAQLIAAVDRVAVNLRDSFSAIVAGTDPALADAGVLDAIAANARISRLPGAAASGGAAVVVRSPRPFVVPAGTAFVADGASFVNPAAHAVRSPGTAAESDTDLILSPAGVGTYAVVVPVVAQADGPAGLIRRGSRLVPSMTIPLLVQCYAEADFTGGISAETNAELVKRFQLGLASHAPSNRVTTEAMLRASAGLSGIRAVSIVGFGDAEMVRDQHTIFPGSTGGRVDVYVRCAPLPADVAIDVSATLVDVTADGGIWQFSIGRDDAPGFYEVTRVAAPGADPASASYEVLAATRGLDVADDDWTPDLASPGEAAYTRYQTATVRFVDPERSTSGLSVGVSRADYRVSARAMPLVADAQAALGARSSRHWGADVLARAAVPCDVTVWCELRRTAITAEPTAAQVVAARAAAAAVVNATGFAGRVASAPIARAIEDALPAGCEVGPLAIRGTIVGPGGVRRTVQDAGRRGEIEVPYLPADGISARTVCFFLRPEDVTFSTTLIRDDA